MIKTPLIIDKNKPLIIFAAVGVINTLIHSTAVISFVELLAINPVLANTFAFFISNILSYFMNSNWTFRVAPNLSGYLKFLIASTGSLFFAIAFSAFAEYMGWHYLIGLFLVIVISPLLTFLVYKTWVFSGKPK